MNDKKMPDAFADFNYKQFYQTVRWTELACQKLKSQGVKINLAMVARVTQEFDEAGQGVHANSIRRNPKAYEVYLRYNPGQEVKKQQSKVEQAIWAQDNIEIPAEYHNWSISEWIKEVQHLKDSIAKLQNEREQLKRKYEQAQQLRNEALKQNTFLLAKLTSIESNDLSKQ